MFGIDKIIDLNAVWEVNLEAISHFFCGSDHVISKYSVIYYWGVQAMVCFKVEYHANAEYKNPLRNSEKIACVGQRLMYPIMEKE